MPFDHWRLELGKVCLFYFHSFSFFVFSRWSCISQGQRRSRQTLRPARPPLSLQTWATTSRITTGIPTPLTPTPRTSLSTRSSTHRLQKCELIKKKNKKTQQEDEIPTHNRRKKKEKTWKLNWRKYLSALSQTAIEHLCRFKRKHAISYRRKKKTNILTNILFYFIITIIIILCADIDTVACWGRGEGPVAILCT